MWNSKRTILIVMVSWIVVVPVCLASADAVVSGRELLQAVRQKDSRRERPVRRDRGAYRTAKTGRGRGDRDRPTAMELLDKYAETQDKLQSFIIKSRDLCEGGMAPKGQRLTPTRHLVVCEFRYDGERLYSRYHKYPRWSATNTPTGEADHYSSKIYDGGYYLRLTQFPRHPFSARCLCLGPEEARDSADHEIMRQYPGRQVMGYLKGDFWKDGNRIDAVLRRAKRISVRDRMEPVGRSQCYVIDAESERGRYTVWIDPQHGYNIAKAEVFRGRKQCDVVFDEIYKKMGKQEGDKGKSCFDSLQVVRFRRIEGVWVPMEAHTEGKATEGKADMFFYLKVHHKRTEVILNPDHDALRSFYPDDIPNGTQMDSLGWLGGAPDRDGWDMHDDRHFRAIWKPGAKFVVNDSYRLVRNDPNKDLLPIVKAVKLSSLVEDFRPEPPSPEVIGRKLLLCVWDINQRQSQQLLLTLAEKHLALAKKGIAVIAIEASGAQTDKVQSWAKENKLTFPVGASYGLYEWFVREREGEGDQPVLSHVVSDLRMAWRIDRLPWLILTTDRELIVTAEGFGLEELNEKIKGNKNNVEQ